MVTFETRTYNISSKLELFSSLPSKLAFVITQLHTCDVPLLIGRLQRTGLRKTDHELLQETLRRIRGRPNPLMVETSYGTIEYDNRDDSVRNTWN